MPTTRLVTGILAATLAGCTLGPQFVPPRADTPAGWTNEAINPQPGHAQASVPVAEPGAPADWWTSFGDPVLTSLIKRAAAANLDLQSAVLRIAEARALRDVAAAAQWPSLSANGSFTRERISEKTAFTSLLGSAGSGTTGGPVGGAPSGGVSSSVPGLPNPFNQFQAGFDASWEIDLFGRVRRSVEAADADMTASVESSRDVLLSLLGEVARSYVDLRGAQRRRAILDENLASRREVLELTRQRRQVGLGNELDVANAAAAVSSTEAELPPTDNRITVDINQLSFLLGREPGALRAELIGPAAAPPVDGPAAAPPVAAAPAAAAAALPAVPPVPPRVPIGLPADLARRRPDIRAAEAQLHAATARIGVATADLFPRLTLNAAVGFQAQHFNDLGDWASRFFSLGPDLELPIFSGGQRQATVRLQDVKAKEAAAAYARTVLAAIHEAENALTAYGSEQARRVSLEAAESQGRDALTLARQRYESGVTTFLDVLEAQQNLQQTQLALADSTATVSIDLVGLYKALGGGWENF
jgi:multidrug efflux system outer membrane protein